MDLVSSLRPVPTTPFKSLPSELVLEICKHLSPHDLWFCARPVSQRFHMCAQEVLMRKMFQQHQTHVSWCCFWCSLGDLALKTVLNDIAPLFPLTQLCMEPLSDDVLISKQAFADMCSTIVKREQKIRISVGGEDTVTVKAGEIKRILRSPIQNLQQRRHVFLMFYFARLRKERRGWRVASMFGWAAHLVGFVVLGAVLLVTAIAVVGIFWVGLETYKMVRSLYGVLRRPVQALFYATDA
ncbi:hypothetical protein BDW02DRAFT_587478 [Decorospora gaudefroyi]|uniref:F-box domain-containing protein n=1 Tax=Decorospora gaudefroyi TaxID=184978 RepID=A0A6A5KPT9_9PLEO|nr:hypothetical protein BDW02DRAFT_587478 [Decorospora gaudefroyi]